MHVSSAQVTLDSPWVKHSTEYTRYLSPSNRFMQENRLCRPGSQVASGASYIPLRPTMTEILNLKKKTEILQVRCLEIGESLFSTSNM